jgi:iron complex outermembrane receptor protein
MKAYDFRSKGNYLAPLGFFTIPLPRVVDLTDIDKVGASAKRNFKAFFIEDIWDITEKLRLTLGARYDDYSDFGDNFNPRAGLTWEFIKGYDLKLLYGRAFRAPSFIELYDSALANPDLDPEEVDTYQVSLGAQFTSSFDSRITWFRNRIKDSISLNVEADRLGYVDYNLTNRDTIRTEGLEVEMKYDLGRGSYLAMNYRYMIFQKRFMEWDIPRHIGNIMANIRLSRYLNFYASCHIEDGLRRDRGDNRDDVSGYGIVNTTLIAKKILKDYEGFELRGAVYNLFDKDYVSPQPASVLPEDLPRPGRNFLVEVKYKF